MAFTDFTLDSLRMSFGITIRQGSLFAAVAPISVPPWLHTTLEKGAPLALGSEKARSEFILAPILLSLRDLAHQQIAIYSGQRLDGDPQVGLTGEIDFLVTATPALPIVQAPIISVVEAKKNDIESSLGQCAAQLLGAQRYNVRDRREETTIYGCVTTGEVWQFLRLDAQILTIDADRYYINDLTTILGILQHIVEQFIVPSSQDRAVLLG